MVIGKEGCGSGGQDCVLSRVGVRGRDVAGFGWVEVVGESYGVLGVGVWWCLFDGAVVS